MIETCHCGLPLHYSDKSIEALMRQTVEQCGSHVKVTTAEGRTFLVQRHYIALHGIKARELPALGFPELTPESAT